MATVIAVVGLEHFFLNYERTVLFFLSILSVCVLLMLASVSFICKNFWSYCKPVLSLILLLFIPQSLMNSSLSHYYPWFLWTTPMFIFQWGCTLDGDIVSGTEASAIRLYFASIKSLVCCEYFCRGVIIVTIVIIGCISQVIFYSPLNLWCSISYL